MDQTSTKPASSTFSRVAKYILIRAVILFFMLCIGIFLAIVVINYGGYIDKIRQADIDESLMFVSLSMRGASPEKVAQVTEQLRWQMEEAAGLHSPFLLRCVRWFYQTITFDWGTTYRVGVDTFLSSTPAKVSSVVLRRAPYTLLLAGATNFILFFASIFVALNLSKRFDSLLDRIMIALSPLSSIPNWVYGILLTVVFFGELHLLPMNGIYDEFPPATQLGYIPIVLKHMILPVSSIFLGMFFSTIYSWRTFFLIHSGEDYLELAKAKGVPTGALERRYMLKPTLPYIITSFAMLMVTFWQGIIVLEVFFEWPGLGQLFMVSIRAREMSVTIGIVTVFALLLGLSVFLLDIIYVLVDPRVKISSDSQTMQAFQKRAVGQRMTEFLRRLWPSGLVNQVRDRIESSSRDLRKQSFPARPIQQHPTRERFTPTHSALVGNRAPIVSQALCPFLRSITAPGPATPGSSQRHRCYVHNHPERIAQSYQASVCRTNTYRTCPRLMPARQARPSPAIQITPIGRTRSVSSAFAGMVNYLSEFKRYPAAVAGIVIILALVGVSIYTIIKIPYREAIERWGPESMGKIQIPKNAQPVWVNWFRKDPLPATMIQNSAAGIAGNGLVSKAFKAAGNGITEETITYTIDYPYTSFPQDLTITFDGKYEKKPFVSLTWLTPDGREFDLGNFSIVAGQRFIATQDLPKKYTTGLKVHTQDWIYAGVGGPPAVQVLFQQPGVTDNWVTVKGTYTLQIDGFLFEEGSRLDAEMILYGQVYGPAGTDDKRRDLSVALLWGIPIALAFGFLGALSTGVISMMIAAVGVWFGGKVDNVIQRLTEINMILPTLPIAITIYYLYSKSIWMILGIIILLSIFGSAVKTYRAAFLQIKESPYIEAAQAYGASNWRLIRHYLVPRIIPLLIPQLVILVPSYVFFEATLAYLQVSDPVLPTWGKVIYDALTRGAFQGYYYWVLEPVALMTLTALAFAVVGFALDSILNPRLRRI